MKGYLTIIPRARLGSESIAQEAEGRIDSEAMMERGIIVLLKSKLLVKNIEKTTIANKTRFSRHCFGFQSRRFSLLVGYNI